MYHFYGFENRLNSSIFTYKFAFSPYISILHLFSNFNECTFFILGRNWSFCILQIENYYQTLSPRAPTNFFAG